MNHQQSFGFLFTFNTGCLIAKFAVIFALFTECYTRCISGTHLHCSNGYLNTKRNLCCLGYRN